MEPPFRQNGQSYSIHKRLLLTSGGCHATIMLHISKDYMTFNNYYYRNRYLKYGTWTHIQLVCRRAEYGFNTAVSVAIGC